MRIKMLKGMDIMKPAIALSFFAAFPAVNFGLVPAYMYIGGITEKLGYFLKAGFKRVKNPFIRRQHAAVPKISG